MSNAPISKRSATGMPTIADVRFGRTFSQRSETSGTLLPKAKTTPPLIESTNLFCSERKPRSFKEIEAGMLGGQEFSAVRGARTCPSFSPQFA